VIHITMRPAKAQSASRLRNPPLLTLRGDRQFWLRKGPGRDLFHRPKNPVIRAKTAQGTALPTLPKRLVPGSHPALEFMDEPRHLSMEAIPLHLIKARTPPALKAARMLPVKIENSAWMVSPMPIQPLG